MKLSELASGLRTVVVPFGDHEINVTYRLAATTPENGENDTFQTPLNVLIPKLVESWDITDDDGNVLPVDDASCSKLPAAVLRAITMGVVLDSGLGEAPSSSADG